MCTLTGRERIPPAQECLPPTAKVRDPAPDKQNSRGGQLISTFDLADSRMPVHAGRSALDTSDESHAEWIGRSR